MKVSNAAEGKAGPSSSSLLFLNAAAVLYTPKPREAAPSTIRIGAMNYPILLLVVLSGFAGSK